MLRALFLLASLLLLPGTSPARPPARSLPRLRLRLRVDPVTRTFTCRYCLRLPPADSATRLELLLPRGLRWQPAPGDSPPVRVRPRYYPYFADTLQQLTLRPPARGPRRLVLTYAGTLDEHHATATALEFSGHTSWLPFRPGREYEPVAYWLRVRVPAPWRVRSTRPVRRRGGAYCLRGRAAALEPTVLLAQQFAQFTTPGTPRLTVCKAGAALLPADTSLLGAARQIVAYYNRTLGRRDPIHRFRLLLPGTDRDAFALLDNAAVITYANFDVRQREDLLILAHEISHRWWAYGSVHSADDWLNEAFATYSSLLYLQARGDTAGYRLEYARRAATVAGTPPLLGFDRFAYPADLYRRVIYNKGMVVLAALRARLGSEAFTALLAAAAGRRVSTTAELLALVEERVGPTTRAWLAAELRR